LQRTCLPCIFLEAYSRGDIQARCLARVFVTLRDFAFSESKRFDVSRAGNKLICECRFRAAYGKSIHRKSNNGKARAAFLRRDEKCFRAAHAHSRRLGGGLGAEGKRNQKKGGRIRGIRGIFQTRSGRESIAHGLRQIRRRQKNWSS